MSIYTPIFDRLLMAENQEIKIFVDLFFNEESLQSQWRKYRAKLVGAPFMESLVRNKTLKIFPTNDSNYLILRLVSKTSYRIEEA